MNIPYDVEVVFHFITSRKIFDGYRPAHKIKDDYLTTGKHHYYNLNGNMKNVKGTITFLSPEYYPNSLWIGKKIEMYEGHEFIGYAEILKINNPILDSKI